MTRKEDGLEPMPCRSGNRYVALTWCLLALMQVTGCSIIVDPDPGALETIPSDGAIPEEKKSGAGICTPGSYTTCYCENGGKGQRVCLSDSTFGTCDCGDDGAAGSGGQVGRSGSGGSAGQAGGGGTGGSAGQAGGGGTGGVAGQAGESGTGGAAGEAGAAGQDAGTVEEPLYGPCDANGQCGEGLECSSAVLNRGTFCTKSCVQASDCPQGSTGDATAACDSRTMTCRLDCPSGATCPDGMSCLIASIGIPSSYACYWQ